MKVELAGKAKGPLDASDVVARLQRCLQDFGAFTLKNGAVGDGR